MADRPAELLRGANLPVPGGTVSATISWKAGKPSIYACAFSSANKVRTSADIVAPARPAIGAISLVRTATSEAVYEVDLENVADDIAKIVFCILAPDRMDCGALAPAIVIAAGGEGFARFELPGDEATEAAAVLGELYRRGDAWKFRAVGQGFKGGVDRLAIFLGCSAQDLRDAAIPAPQPKPVPPQPVPPEPKASSAPTAPAQASRRPPQPALDEPERAEGVFSCRGWQLLETGVGPPPGERRRGAGALELELLDLRRDTGGQYWPAHFQYQPISGEKLPSGAHMIRTIGRPLAPSGLPHLVTARSLDQGSRRLETMREGARLFASGGTPARLVAINPVDGQAWWKAPMRNEWVAIGRCPPAVLLEPFASGAVGTPEGIFYGSEDALIHLLAGQRAGFERLSVGGTPIGPPAVVADSVLLPVASQSGLALAIRTPGGALAELPVNGASNASGPLGSPVVNEEAGMCFWVGRSGFLVFEEGMEEASAAWRAWPPGIEGLPFLPPFRAANGRFWAMCAEITGEETARGRALACVMAPSGSKEKKQLLGPHVSVGTQTYRECERYAQPWDEAEETITIGSDYKGRWLLPLIRIGANSTVVGLVRDSASQVEGARHFVFREGPGRPRDLALALHEHNGALTMLDHSFRISSTDDFEIFMDADRLCIHHPESNICASWSLSF
jgi:hypothetical protein